MPRIRLLLAVLVVAISAGSASAAQAATALYPDLRTLPPRDLRFDYTDVSVDGSGDYHTVLRFSNTAWNAGPGKLVLTGQIDPTTLTGPAVQTVYNTDGTYTNYTVGSFYYHAVHQHYHFEDWGRYELWSKTAWDEWNAAGRPSTTQPDIVGTKTTSCVLDEEYIQRTLNAPFPGVYGGSGCLPDSGGTIREGLSPGWGDTYDYYRYEQWLDLGSGHVQLPDGQYVVRSVTDPLNKIYESPDKSDPSVESQQANEAVTPITISGGQLVDTQAPTGTVSINGVDPSTSTTNVTVRVLGRDDVSGVDKVRLSNDGVSWSPSWTYGGSGSTPMSISWDLADGRYGGTTNTGTHTVYAQFHDVAGHWSPSITDSIQLTTGTGGGTGSGSAYAQAVKSDTPVSYWRLDETTGTAAADQMGANPGTYVNSPTLAASSLLTSDPNDPAVRFGSPSSMHVADSASLQLGHAMSVEAWIRPSSIPAPGSWASIITRPESYSLQFNGPLLEFTVIQNGTRHRLQAPSGAITPGLTYHVVGTYDGISQRLYINGAQVGSAALSGDASAGSGGLNVASWDGTSEYFDGTVDEAAIYHSVLTGLQVSNHYNAGVSTTVGVASPSGLSATAASSSAINLAWTDNASNETGYVVQRSADSTFSSPVSISLPAGSTSYSDTGLNPSTTYYYRVQAVNGTDSSGWSNTASATTQSTTVVVAAPTSLSATAASSSGINLAWTDNATNETGYVVQRSADSTFSSPVSISLGAGATSYADSGLSASTTYYYRVKAVSGTTSSAWSNTASATTQAPPPPPPSSYAQTVSGDGPLAWWRLGESSGTVARDAGGVYNGTYLNGPALGSASLLATDTANTAVGFDGVNDSVRVPDANALHLRKGFSLEAWVRPSALPATGAFATVVSKPEAYSLQFNGSRMELTVINSGYRNRCQAASGAVPTGQTTYVVGTYDGAAERLYLNGRLAVTCTLSSLASVTSTPVGIGSWDGTSEFLHGTIDEAAIYNKVLSASQVSTHYTAGSGSSVATSLTATAAYRAKRDRIGAPRLHRRVARHGKVTRHRRTTSHRSARRRA